MIYHGVYFLSVVVKLDSFSTLGIASGSGLCRLMGPLRGVLFRVDFSTLRSSEECLEPCNNHVFFALMGASIGWPAFFVLRLPARPFSGLVVEASSPPFCFLTWPPRLASDLVGILEGVPP